MKNIITKKILFPLFLLISALVNAQNIGINVTGTNPSINAILDLNTGNSNNYGLIIPNVTLGASLATFNPPIANAPTVGDKGMMVYNSVATNQPIGYYYWNGAAWVSVGGGGGAYTANNGLTLTGTNFQLGGNLVQNTTITLNGFTKSIVGSTETTYWSATGQVGIGNVAPNAKAVVDLNNATNLGLMLPGMTTANLPAITAAQNGLVVFNTTIGCPEYASGGTWIVLGANHGTTTFNYTGSVQSFSIPSCVNTITITATGAAGGTSTLNLGGNGATVTQSFVVISGHTLSIVVGDNTGGNDYAGGGGGGSFVWDNASTNYPMIAAGGGGGGGYSDAGANGSTTITPTASVGSGAGGAGGAAGAQGATTKPGAGGGGAGWNTVAGNPAAATATSGQGGIGEPSAFVGGASATSDPIGSAGGYGGGGGGGYNNTSTWGGGGGGSGYNGGGGGSAPTNAAQHGGGGGGSGYYNGPFPYTTAGNFVSPTVSSSTNTGNGSVTITY